MKIARDKVVSCLLMAAGIVILILYPLRHVNAGVDLWDGGYNYANFRYPGLEYMDSMWYFATWLANQLGTFLAKLPFGNTMLGMNVYTGLIVSFMAVFSWGFAVKKLKVPAWIAFVGEIIAVSLCWAPTAVLYNYLTYGFLLVGTVLLYHGLTTDRHGFLIAAGVVLGANVAVRFSNLPQAALIIAVWSYGAICRKKFSGIMKETGFCILGYAGAFGAYLLFMSAVYGFSDYVEGIMRLFGMTETAQDYAPAYMLKELFDTYYQCSYWLKRFVLIVAGGGAVCLILPRKWEKIKKGLIIVITLVITAWLIRKGFYSGDYHVYQAIFDPCVTVLTMMLLLSGYLLVSKHTSGEDKLMAVLMITTVLITSLGSNNAVYSSINNLFLVMPWFLGMVWKFCLERKHIWYYPFKCVLLIVILILGVQSLRFGQTFVYEEATGGRNMDTVIQDVPVLKGIRTSEEKAEALTALYEYLEENRVGGQKCLLYGQIPGVSYYMELPPALNTWSDLASYTLDTMKDDLNKLSRRIEEGEQKPVIILEETLLTYLESEPENQVLVTDSIARQKMQLIRTFMEKYEYQNTFVNDKYAVYQ